VFWGNGPKRNTHKKLRDVSSSKLKTPANREDEVLNPKKKYSMHMAEASTAVSMTFKIRRPLLFRSDSINKGTANRPTQRSQDKKLYSIFEMTPGLKNTKPSQIQLTQRAPRIESGRGVADAVGVFI
jgi:hypothetical protein